MLSGARVSHQDIDAARQYLLDGGAPTNKLHTAWLDWARGVRAGERGYHAPQVPDEWVRRPGQAAESSSLGGAPVEDDEFAAFVRAFLSVARPYCTPIC